MSRRFPNVGRMSSSAWSTGTSTPHCVTQGMGLDVGRMSSSTFFFQAAGDGRPIVLRSPNGQTQNTIDPRARIAYPLTI